MNRLQVMPLVVMAVVLLVLAGSRPSAQTQTPSLAARLEVLRAQANVPALVGATFSSTGAPVVAVAGVRKVGSDVAATTDDLWHIGSITKSFTSLLVAQAVERGDLTWTSTLGDLVGVERARKFAPVTLAQLLSHRAGLPANLTAADRAAVMADNAPVTMQRQRVIDRVLAGAPESAPGETIHYSNLSYIIAGAMLESKRGTPWEEQVRRDVLDPLGLKSAGQGAPGVAGVLTQPRGHRAGAGGALIPVEPGPLADNPPFLGPAGRLHMTVTDLARWGQVHLRGERGQDGLVSAETFRRLHQPELGNYAMGWVSQPVAGRRAVWHNGSNTMWYAIVAFDPEADRGVVLITNGGIGAGPTLDAAAMAALR